jgi:molybdate-binding protein/DNA-binding XRE family transcriptional regulator
MAQLRNRLRDVRMARGLTQQALAQRAGLTRQTVGAIEAGDYGPSLEVGLRLAGALDVPIGDIFSLRKADTPDGGLLPRAGTARVLSAVIGGREVLRGVGQLGAYRWPAAAADGLAEVDAEGAVSFQRFGDLRQDTVFIAGCDPALGLVADHLQRQGTRAFWFTAGSGEAREQLRLGRAHFAAVHWTEGEEPPEPPPEVARVILSRWQMGIVARKGSELSGDAVALARPGLRIVNRERGAGARRLLDRLIGEAALSPARVLGYDRELPGHWEVVEAIARGEADLGIASAAAAAACSLAFRPLTVETCEVWWRVETVGKETAERLLGTLRSAAFGHDLTAFGPFDTSRTGAAPDDQRGRG